MLMVQMKSHEFNSLDEVSLGTAYFQPLIQAFKEVRMRGEDEGIFYAGLTEGQQKLFIFRVFYNHVYHSPEELFWWSAYFLAQSPKWRALKNSLEVHGDEGAVRLLEDIESLLTAKGYSQSLDKFEVSRSDIAEDSELLDLFNEFYDRFQSQSVIIHQRIAQFIRTHPEQFVHVE